MQQLWRLSPRSGFKLPNKIDSLHERKRYHNRTFRIRSLHHQLEICQLHQRLIVNEAAKKGKWRKAIKLEVCTGPRIARAVAVESPNAVGP